MLDLFWELGKKSYTRGGGGALPVYEGYIGSSPETHLVQTF